MKVFIDKINKNYLFGILGLGLIFVIWHLLAIYYNNSLIIPSIKETFIALFTLLKTSRFFKLLFMMIFRIIITVFISLVVSLLLAILSFKSSRFNSFLNPIIIIMKTIPIVAIIILLLVFVGMKLTPYVATSFVIIPLIYEMIYASLKQIDPAITDDIKTVSKIDFKLICLFYIPLIANNVLTSIIQSFGLGLKVMLMAEFMSPMTNTFGAEISRYYNNNDMAKVLAIVIIVILIVFASDRALKKFRDKTELN